MESFKAETTFDCDGRTYTLRATFGALMAIERETEKPITQLVAGGLASMMSMTDLATCVYQMGKAAGEDFKSIQRDVGPLLQQVGTVNLIPLVLNVLLDGWNGPGGDDDEVDPTGPASRIAGSTGGGSTDTP